MLGLLGELLFVYQVLHHLVVKFFLFCQLKSDFDETWYE